MMMNFKPHVLNFRFAAAAVECAAFELVAFVHATGSPAAAAATAQVSAAAAAAADSKTGALSAAATIRAR